MGTSRFSWGAVAVLAALLGLCLAAPGLADEKEKKGKGKGKGKDADKSQIIQLDTSKLPPDLVKALLKYAAGGEKKGKGKPQAEEKKPEKKSQARKESDLPPGLAKKPKDHPGRLAFLRGESKKAEPEKKSGKSKKDDKKKPGNKKGEKKPGKKKDKDD